MVRVAISGGFDPIHGGHIDMINDCAEAVARHTGETHPELLKVDIVVFVNSNDWVERKKGRVFMHLHERTKILKSIKGVSEVYQALDGDSTVCASLRSQKPDYFANGGDRKEDNTPELDVCEELGIIPLFNVGGGKTQSSSELLEGYAKGKEEVGTLPNSV